MNADFGNSGLSALSQNTAGSADQVDLSTLTDISNFLNRQRSTLESTLTESQSAMKSLQIELDLALNEMDAKARKTTLFTRLKDVKINTD